MTLRGPASTISDLLVSASDRYAQRLAIIDGEKHLSYRELLASAESFAEMLTTLGVDRGERVGIVLPRSADAVAAFFGIALAGAVAVPISEQLKAPQVAQTIADARASAVVTDARHELLLPAPAPAPAAILRLVIPDGGALSDAAPFAVSSLRPSPVPAIGKDLAALLYTSGSTGRPKGIMVTHENLTWGAAIVAAYLELGRDDRLVTALPLSFDYGLNQVLAAIDAGASVVVVRSPHPGVITRAIENEGATGLAGVPVLWHQLAGRYSPFFERTLPTLRYITNTGGSLAPELVARFRAEKPHVRVFLMYGFTEAFRSTYLDPDEIDRRPTSIGRAIPNTEVLVVDECGRICAPGEVGELVHRGPTVAAGYWDDPTSTAQTFRPNNLPHGTGETIAYSGDLVRRDEDGFLYFVGRRDELFKSRGIRLNPEQIELELRRCEAIADAIVFTTPGAGSDGEPSIVAAFVASTAEDPVSAAQQFCRSELPAHMRPARLEPVAEIPRTPHGKPDREQARRLWGQKQVAIGHR